jgi:hypothetical protein
MSEPTEGSEKREVGGARIVWSRGGEAVVMALKDDAITLRSSIPSPPGSRIEGALEAPREVVRVKVHSSKQKEDGGFVIEGRVLDMTRALRERLSSSVER